MGNPMGSGRFRSLHLHGEGNIRANSESGDRGVRLFKVIAAVITALVTLIGLLVVLLGGGPDLSKLLLAVSALTPPYFFYTRIYKPSSVIVCGIILLAVTLPAWGVYLYTVIAGVGEGMGGVYIMPAIVISFVTVLIGWSKED